MRQYVTEKVLRDQIGLDPAIFASEQTVGFSKNCRCTALRALVFNKKIDDSLRAQVSNFIAFRHIRYNTWNQTDFLRYNWGKISFLAYLQLDDRNESKIWHSESDFFRIRRIA